jgi:hypothetical protein
MESMTAEAKAAVMQLMGVTYGQQKQQDQMIIGSSGNLKPRSNEMKTMVEQLLQSPTATGTEQRQQYPTQPQQQYQNQPTQLPPALVTLTPEQAMAELQLPPAPVEVNPYLEEQLGFDFSEPSQGDQILAAVKENTLLLKAIKLQLEISNVRPTRKSAKSKVAG